MNPLDGVESNGENGSEHLEANMSDRNTWTAAVTAAVFALFAVSPAMAMGPSGDADGAQHRMQELQEEIGNLQSRALEENPELRERADAIDEMLFDQLEEMGHEDVREQIEAYQTTMREFEAGEISQREAYQRMQEHQQAQQRLQQAHQQALQDESFAPDYISKQQQLQQDIEEAVLDMDADAEALFEEMQELQTEMHGGRP